MEILCCEYCKAKSNVIKSGLRKITKGAQEAEKFKCNVADGKFFDFIVKVTNNYILFH